MARKAEISGLQIMCQYQIPALLSGGNPALVLSDEFVAGVRFGYAQTPTKCTKSRKNSRSLGEEPYFGGAPTISVMAPVDGNALAADY